LGYLTVRARSGSPLLAAGDTARGHEFHWSDYEGPPAGEPAFTVVEDADRTEGFAAGNLLASYVHLHFGAGPGMAPRFVAACRAWWGQ
jgi:cobyrinic acid a,c-diamide synthase